jgi:GNAT superfamily N-acetyltransferase
MRAQEFIIENTIKLSPQQRAYDWIQKVYAAYPQTWQNNHVMPLGGSGEDQQFAMFELTPSNSKRDAVEVKWFQAYPLRAGVGSRAMRELQRLAQEDNIALTLYPWDKGQVSQSKLMKFYRAQGFRPAVKGSKNMAWEPVPEAFNNPYKTKSEKSEYGDVDMLAKLPDGTNLSIMFNNQQDDEGKEVVQVEFYRNNSQEVTGEGDAQRIFATVLSAIQKYIKKYKPSRLSFSASKATDPTIYYEPDQPQPNPESRAKLYDRLVQRYAKAWGYRAFRADTGDLVIYELSRVQPAVAENFADGGNPVKFTVTSPDGYKHSFQITLAVHGKHVGHFNFVRSADTDDVNNEAEVESRWQGQGYGKLLLMKAIDVANNHGLDFQQDIRGITDAQQNVYDSLENAGLIVTPGDGFWFLTPQGEQELNGLNENFADGKVRGKSRPGRVKRAGASCDGSVTDLRARAKRASGEKAKMYHWCANMKSGRNK